MDCKTPSNPLGLEAAYDIPKGNYDLFFYFNANLGLSIGESLTINDIIKLTNGQLTEEK